MRELSEETRQKLRKAGRKGGKAPHSRRGLQCLTKESRHTISRWGIKARKLRRKLLALEHDAYLKALARADRDVSRAEAKLYRERVQREINKIKTARDERVKRSLQMDLDALKWLEERGFA